MSGKILTVACNPSVDRTVEVEKLTAYGLNRAVASRTDPGGKGVNVARVLHRFGVETLVTGFAAGKTGGLLQEALRRAGIGCDFLEIEGETRTNLKIVDRSAHKTTEVNEAGCPVDAAAQGAFRRKYEGLLRGASAVVLSGSLPPGLPAGFYAWCIDAARRAGVPALLDADGDALRLGLEAAPFAVKPNIHELEALCGRRLAGAAEVAGAARELLARGVELVVVSMGADGAVAADRSGAVKTECWKIRENSPIGAGDSMVATIACSMQGQDSLGHTARMATAAGTITASKPGTELCTLQEVLDAVGKVSVHPL